MVYQLPFTDSNSVRVEIDHEFGARAVDRIDVYRRESILVPWKKFPDRILLGFTYLQRQHGFRGVKLLPIRWGVYLLRFSPKHQPKHRSRSLQSR